jgi:hypothetical protein
VPWAASSVQTAISMATLCLRNLELSAAESQKSKHWPWLGIERYLGETVSVQRGSSQAS